MILIPADSAMCAEGLAQIDGPAYAAFVGPAPLTHEHTHAPQPHSAS